MARELVFVSGRFTIPLVHVPCGFKKPFTVDGIINIMMMVMMNMNYYH